MSKLVINTNQARSTIHRNLYGHFAEHLGRCIYQGLFVGEDSTIPHVNGMRSDVVAALKKIHVPVLRWPGGCFADEYHWKDGIGPRENRKRMVNTNWGGVVEDNSFGTHEFMELCRQIGCEPYINGNVGSGTVQEMSDWVEYLTFDGVSPISDLRKQHGQEKPWALTYFGIGNENWGCGGNMRPEYYADLYRQYQTYVRNYSGNNVYKIACGPNDFNYQWTEVLMERAAKYMDALTVHYYTVPGDTWENKGSATDFTKQEYYKTLQKALRMDEIISSHLHIMDQHDPEHRVDLIVDEWGAWYDVEPGTNPGFLYQQNTMRDAMIAALTLNIFNQHSDRVKMANLAQMVNVLQALILTEGSQMVLTPTYHVFDLFQQHQDATLVEQFLETETIQVEGFTVPTLQASSSIKNGTTLTITMVNLSDCDDHDVQCDVLGWDVNRVSGRILSGNCSDYNDFDQPNHVSVSCFSDFTQSGNQVSYRIPACSVMEITMERR